MDLLALNSGTDTGEEEQETFACICTDNISSNIVQIEEIIDNGTLEE